MQKSTVNEGASTTFAKSIAEIVPPIPVESVKQSEKITTIISQNSTKPIPPSSSDKLAPVVTSPTKVEAKIDASKNGDLIDAPQKPLDTILDKEDDKKKQPNIDNDLGNDNEDSEDIFGNQSSAIPDVAGEKNEDEYDDDTLPEENREELKQAQQEVPDHGMPNEHEQQQNPTPKVLDVNFQEDPDSNFFAYLCGIMFLCVFLYILQQNRHKILALCLEGRRGSRRGRERSRGGSKAAYSKLDCNLEEAIMSKKSLNGKSMDIIY